MTFSLDGGNTGNVFAINSTSGEITVSDNTNLDFETLATYSFTISVDDGIGGTVSAVITINVTDVEEEVLGLIQNNDRVKVYPNPAKDYIDFEIEQSLGFAELFIVDVSGKQVINIKRFSGERIDIEKLNKGTYFIQISENQKIMNTIKLVKE